MLGAEAAVAARGVFNNLRKSSLVSTALLVISIIIIYYALFTDLSSSAGAIGLEYISSVKYNIIYM